MQEPMPITLPPGFFGNGTPYSAMGRYYTGNLVRFVEGFARPVGGWARRLDSLGVPIPPLFADPETEAPRLAISWTDNLAATHIVVGTNLGLYHIGSSGSVSDISPAGFTGGEKDSQYIIGYGTGRYGREAYGTSRTGSGAPLDQVANWSFSTFGEILLAQFRGTGPLYKWAPGDGAATPITEAPEDAQGVLVTSERIVMTIKRQPRLVEWSDSESLTDWTPAIVNTAGSQVLSGLGDLQAIVQVGRDILILSTEDAWIGRYIGAPFIYGFEPIGQNCGCTAPNSVAVVAGRAYWFGRGGFWTYDGTVRKLESEVEDWVRGNISATAITKMVAVEQPGFREIWWFFQSSDGDDCDTYITFNHAGNHWTFGALPRGAGIPPGVSQTPVYVGTDGILYNHDLAGVAVPLPNIAFLETGPLQLGQGGGQMGVQYFFPDLTPQFVDLTTPQVAAMGVPSPVALAANPDNGAELIIIGKDFPSPNEPERLYGPYPLDRPSPTTGARGREIRLRYVGKTARWRVGVPRIMVTAMGGR